MIRTGGRPASAMRLRQLGVSLVELLVVTALLALTCAATLVDWPYWLRPQQGRQWLLQTQQALVQLRLQAMREREDITVCAASGAAACTARWQGGWQVFADANLDQRWQPGERRYPLVPELPAGWHLHWQSFRRDPVLIWRHAGDAGFSNGTLTLCPPRPQDAALMQLVISRSGRLRMVVPLQLDAAAVQSARTRCGWGAGQGE